MRVLKQIAFGLALMVAGTLGGAVQAAPIPWSNSSGMSSTLMWSNGQSDNGLFGDPVIVDNDPSSPGTHFIFFPNNFKAVSSNGIAANTSDRLSVTLMVKSADAKFLSFDVKELGDYSILGTGSVSATGALFVTNLNSPFGTASDTLHTNPPMPVTTVTAASGNWEGNESVPGNGWTKVQLVLNNVLQATSGPNSTSQIEKKVVPIDIRIIVPEPTTAGLLLMTGGMFLARRRTKVA